MEAIEILEGCLGAAKGMHGELIDISGDQQRLLWLESQLSNVIGQLQGMLADIEVGLTLQDIGFSSQKEFEEMIEDIEAQMNNLKMQIHALREVGR